MPRETFQCPHPCGEPLLTQAFTGGRPTLAGSFGSVSYGVTAPLLWVLLCQNFVCALKDWNPCFPQSSGRPVVKPHWPSRPDYWGFSVLLSDCQASQASQQWGSEPSQYCENFFGIIVLQSVDHPPGMCGI